MVDADPWYDDISFPGLLRAARAVYGSAIRGALASADFDDIPRNGIFVLGGIARAGAPLGEIIDALAVSKQAAGQLVDTLVVRGYLDRNVDADDRRRLTIALTERGRAAAVVIRTAVDAIDASLEARVGREHLAITRAALGALVEVGPPSAGDRREG